MEYKEKTWIQTISLQKKKENKLELEREESCVNSLHKQEIQELHAVNLSSGVTAKTN